jgi:hypothetical protein
MRADASARSPQEVGCAVSVAPVPVRERGLRDTATTEASGLNSVLGQPRHLRRLSTPAEAGCTDDASDESCLLVNVPHSGACSTEDERLGTERMDRHEAGHMAP